MINPAMIAFMLKAKIEEIINGVYPDGFFLIEKSDKKIVLGLSEPEKYEGIKLNSVKVSVTYNEIEIIIKHGND